MLSLLKKLMLEGELETILCLDNTILLYGDIDSLPLLIVF